MKKLLKTIPLFLLTAITCACDNGQTQPTDTGSFNVKTFSSKVVLSTEKQMKFFSENTFYGDNTTTLDSSISGLTEQSRPNPVNITWDDTNSALGYYVSVSEKENMSNPIEYFAEDNEIDIYNLKVNTKYYFQVRENRRKSNKSKIGTFTTDSSIRNLYFDGVTNVRDIGGYYKGEGGKTIKQGLLFRGGRLNNSYPLGSGAYGTDWSKKDTTAKWYEREITEKGIEEFERLGIKNEIDLRQHNANGYPGNEGDEVIVKNVDSTYYNPFPMSTADPLANSGNKAAVKGIFEMMADEKNYPFYIHCNIGTNRTGTILMLAEALCGVGEEELLKDYMFSNFGTICIAERQYDQKQEHRAETTDVTRADEVFSRLVAAPGSTMSEKAKYVLGQAGVSSETCNKVKKILIG